MKEESITSCRFTFCSLPSDTGQTNGFWRHVSSGQISWLRLRTFLVGRTFVSSFFMERAEISHLHNFVVCLRLEKGSSPLGFEFYKRRYRRPSSSMAWQRTVRVKDSDRGWEFCRRTFNEKGKHTALGPLAWQRIECLGGWGRIFKFVIIIPIYLGL